MSPRTHTSFNGKLLRIDDEVFEDFTGDILTSRGLHEAGGYGADKLREHADDIREIAQDLLDAITEDGNDKELWMVVLALGLNSGEQGKDFIDAYSYMRLTRFLDVEFGPDETQTTELLRQLAIGRVATVFKAGRVIKRALNFFSVEYPSQINDEIFSHGGFGQPHPELASHVRRSARESVVDDPALARVISTLVAQSCEVVDCLDSDYLAELFGNNKRIFKDEGMRTKAKKVKIIDWVDSDIRETDEDEEKKATAGLVIHRNPDSPLKWKFDQRLAACYVDRQDFETEEEYQKEVDYMLGIMFPERGQSTRPAKSYCHNCRIRPGCLDYALENGIKHGIWGGESERGRRKIRRGK